VALVVLDASVVIGFLDPEDTLHAACVTALAGLEHDDLVVPASAYAEILVGPYRAGAEAVAEVDAFLSDFAIRIEPITTAVARTAAQLRSSKKSLRLPDALVLACGEAIGAEAVLTGDDSLAKAGRQVRHVGNRR